MMEALVASGPHTSCTLAPTASTTFPRSRRVAFSAGTSLLHASARGRWRCGMGCHTVSVLGCAAAC